MISHRVAAAAYRAELEEALRARLPQWHAQIPVACGRQPWGVDMAHVGPGQWWSDGATPLRHLQANALHSGCSNRDIRSAA